MAVSLTYAGKNMDHDVSHALREFTQRYVELWQQERGHAPASQALYGVPSPCIVENREDEVLWLPQPFEPAATLEKVEAALELRLQSDAHRFYTQQYAGDMSAQFGEHRQPAAGLERRGFYPPAGEPDRPSGDAKAPQAAANAVPGDHRIRDDDGVVVQRQRQRGAGTVRQR